MFEHLYVILVVSLYFLVHFACLVSLTVILKKYSNLEWLECAVGSLALQQVLKLALMSGTSFFHALSHFYSLLYWGIVCVLLCSAVSALICDRRVRDSLTKIQLRTLIIPSRLIVFFGAAIFSAFLILVLLRASYFTDNIFDVENYGYTKIAYYFQNNSIFHLSGLKDLRIDSFERNGELNFLHAFLVTKDFRFIGFAGVEVWLGIIIGIYFLMRVLKTDSELAIFFALLVASMPAVFGLSGLTKGDSWSAMSFVCGVGFLILIRSYGFSYSRFFFFVVFLALSASSKLSISFAVALILPFGLWVAMKSPGYKFQMFPWIAVIFTCLLISNKQLQNIITYGNPFQQDSWSKNNSGFSFDNLVGSLPDFGRWLLGIQGDLIIFGWHSDLLKGFGLVIWFLGIYSLIAIASKNFNSSIKKSPIRDAGILLATCAISAFMFAAYIKNEGDFKIFCRFLLPQMLVIICILFAWLAVFFQKNQASRTALCLGIVIVVSYHFVVSLNTTTTLSHKGKRDLIERISNYDRYQSRFGLEFGPGAEAISIYRNSKEPIKILVYTLDYGSPYSWTFGDNFVWNTTVTDKYDHFFELLGNQKFDYICIAHYKNSQARDIEKPISSQFQKLQIISLSDWANVYKIEDS